MVAQIDRQMLRRRPWKIPGRLIAYALIEGRPLTTRGQWINPLVFALYRIAQWLPAPGKSQPPIYIIGTGRSGTTVLGKLFALHKDVVFLNEPKALWHFSHGSEDLIGSYSDKHASVLLDASDASFTTATKLARVYGWARFWGVSRRVVDKYPELVFRVPFVTALFPQARFVAILRDGVDTCSSVTKWSARKGVTDENENHDWWGRNDRKWHLIVDHLVPRHPDLAPLAPLLREAKDHRDRAAVEWIISMRAARQAQTDFPQSVHCLRYEDLCADPVATLADVQNHCNLSPDPVFVQYAQAIISDAESHDTLALMSQLVGPFRGTLTQQGYGHSTSRVMERQA